uniref:Auxin response factor n=1 Tax=Rhizophora mucronata TaxID=61149 RepID=A0A2P2QWG4_RHIMU
MFNNGLTSNFCCTSRIKLALDDTFSKTLGFISDAVE